MNESYERSEKGCYSVREEDEEEDIEDVNNIQDRYMENHNETMSHHGSHFDDEEEETEDKFKEAIS